MIMITLNSILKDGRIQPIPHIGDNPDRVGEIMTSEEIHEFGLGLLIVYLYKQKGDLISSNGNLSMEYPHLVARNPKGELLYIWVRTEITPIVPRYIPGENHEEIISLAKQNNATPVFAGIVLTPTEENTVPICGGDFIAQFTGFKQM